MPDEPVFLDTTGRRRVLVTLIALVAVLVCSSFLAAVVAALFVHLPASVSLPTPAASSPALLAPLIPGSPTTPAPAKAPPVTTPPSGSASPGIPTPTALPTATP